MTNISDLFKKLIEASRLFVVLGGFGMKFGVLSKLDGATRWQLQKKSIVPICAVGMKILQNKCCFSGFY
jgi:hypothetical protein